MVIIFLLIEINSFVLIIPICPTGLNEIGNEKENEHENYEVVTGKMIEVYIIIVRTRQKWNYDVQTGLQTHYIQLSSQIISSTFVNIQHHQVINSIMSHRGPKVVICLSNQHIT